MKKCVVVLLLVVLICASLMACGKSNSEHADLINMLEKGEYERAHYYIDDLKRKAEEKLSEDEKKESLLPILYGEWATPSSEVDDAYKVVSFNEDSTCTIGNDTLKWRVSTESNDYLSGKISEGETIKYSFDLSVNTSTKETSLTLYSVKDDNSNQYLGNYYNLSFYDAIEISADNWSDYFEIKEEGKFNENAFGEVNDFALYQEIVLKEEYQEKFSTNLSNLVMEIGYTYGNKGCEVDMTNKTYKLLDDFDAGGNESNSNIYNFYNNGDKYYASLSSSYYNKDNGYLSSYKTDIKCIRSQGTIYLLK